MEKWIVDGGFIVTEEEMNPVCKGVSLEWTYINWEKNRHIIAAAPEMFEALKMVLRDCEKAAMAFEYDALSTETFDAITAAIAKAKGQ